MSNENDSILDDITADFRVDDTKTAATSRPPYVKPAIHVDAKSEPGLESLTPAQMIAIAKLVEKTTKETILNSSFDPAMVGQVLPKGAAPIVDFSNLTMDDVYDLSINIEAKPFMSADVLKIDLKDSNYEARWVNKNPQNLGNKIAKGFTYVTAADLANPTNQQVSLDAQSHYSYDDVVAMKIDKATYYRALRAAHERALATTNEVNARKRAARAANGYMLKESGASNDYQQAAVSRKMEFYDPDAARITI